ncbi:hypothetical protein TIFTF001_039185 [Ficus carica]|uniref:Uncharacterized protein n=1 Tax=Ficus carica TaxID=3494 RepID=A0AA88EDS7_FICCA|nr:hypothetical protein TIFTF001_039185 [Ficus carica]
MVKTPESYQKCSYGVMKVSKPSKELELPYYSKVSIFISAVSEKSEKTSPAIFSSRSRFLLLSSSKIKENPRSEHEIGNETDRSDKIEEILS